MFKETPSPQPPILLAPQLELTGFRASVCGPAWTNVLLCSYAASAKNIKTAASKNEDPMEAKVRELSEEIKRLKKALEDAGQDPTAAAPAAGAEGAGSGAEAGPGAGSGPAAPPSDPKAVTSYIDTLSEEEKEAYLEQLSQEVKKHL